MKDDRPPFVHAKLYVIDDRLAYLGSANCTNMGLFDNLEAMVRLTSADAVAALAQYVDELFDSRQLPAYPPKVWARPFFPEYRGVAATTPTLQDVPATPLSTASSSS